MLLFLITRLHKGVVSVLVLSGAQSNKLVCLPLLLAHLFQRLTVPPVLATLAFGQPQELKELGSAVPLFDAGETATVTPFVEFAAQGIGLVLEQVQMAGSEETVAPVLVKECDGRVDDGGL